MIRDTILRLSGPPEMKSILYLIPVTMVSAAKEKTIILLPEMHLIGFIGHLRAAVQSGQSPASSLGWHLGRQNLIEAPERQTKSQPRDSRPSPKIRSLGPPKVLTLEPRPADLSNHALPRSMSDWMCGSSRITVSRNIYQCPCIMKLVKM